jgi:tRNA pseudouridine55 synthase
VEPSPDELRSGGLLLVDKPLGWTSFDVVKKLRGALRSVLQNRMKVGHAGTLDPLATGLVIIGFGGGTKRLEALAGQAKTYTATVYLGATTASYDAETPPTDQRSWHHLDLSTVRLAAQGFQGELEQRPPIFSAKHVDGERAYFLARAGERPVMEPRRVIVHALRVHSMDGPEVAIEVHCGKGTYIRSLAHDLGQALGCGAYLKTLRRTALGAYSVDQARTPEQWSKWFDECAK